VKKQPLAAKTSSTLNGKGVSLLTFKVAGQIYGIAVGSVVRIIEMVTITSLPGAPDSIRGFINVHGKAVPVADLRQRFGLPQVAYTLHTPIILVHVDNGLRTLGLVVDAVDQVLDAPSEGLEMTETIVPTDLVGPMAQQAPHLAGVAKVDRHMILVLDVKALLTQGDQVQLSKALEQQGLAPADEV
jgi:purine-binding chemotaxis protein CheW